MRFIMCQTLSPEDRSELQAGRSSTEYLLRWRQAGRAHAERALVLPCWNTEWCPWKRSWWRPMSWRNLPAPFSISGAFTEVEPPDILSAVTPPTCHLGNYPLELCTCKDLQSHLKRESTWFWDLKLGFFLPFSIWMLLICDINSRHSVQ